MSDFGDWTISQREWQRRQTEDISYLQSGLSRANATAARTQTALSRMQGSLEVKLARLTEAFEAFVELSELRERLAMFDAPQLARFRTREALLDLGDGRFGGNLADFDDVPGYWLPPAVTGFITLLQSGASRSRTLIAEGARRDQLRTVTFGTLLLGVVGRGAELPDASWLDIALPPLSADVALSRAQRAVWIAAADGAYGAYGHDFVAARLRELLGGLTADQAGELRSEWTTALRAAAGTKTDHSIAPLPEVLRTTDTIVAGADSAATLHGVRRWLEDVWAAQLPMPGPARSMLAPGVVPDDVIPADAADGTPGAEADGSADADDAAAVVRALVDEGSAEEAPWLSRVRALQATIAGNGVASNGVAGNAPVGSGTASGSRSGRATDGDSGDPADGLRWDAPVQDPLVLLRDDAFDGAHPGRQQPAVAAGSAVVVAIAEELAAAVPAWPARVQVRVGRNSIEIDPTAGTAEQLADYDRSISAGLTVDPAERRTGMLASIAGGVVLVAGLALLAVSAVVGVIVAIVGLIGLGYGVRTLGLHRRAQGVAATQRDAKLADAGRRVAAVTAAYRDYTPVWSSIRQRTADDLEAIRAAATHRPEPPA